MHKFGYSSEQLKLKEHQDQKDIIKSQITLSQKAHSHLNEDFESETQSFGFGFILK